MKPYRHIPLAVVFVSQLARLTVGCSEEEGARVSDALDASDGSAVTTTDAGETDATDDAVHEPRPDAADEAVVCTVEPCATQLVAGAKHFCALLADKTVRCWGDDTRGALGSGDADSSDDAGVGPSAVTSLADVTAIAAADETSCALLGSGEVRCWGANDSGQLGTGTTARISDDEPHPTPATVALPAPARRIDVGHGTTCAVMRDDEESVVCWGANGSRQLGRSDAGPVGRPVSITVAESPVVRTGGDRRSVFAVTEDGHLFSWGAVSGRIGSLDPDPDPAMLPALSNVTSFAAGPQHACAVTDGDVRCWSSSTAAPLCSGLIESARLPLRAPLPTKGWVVARQVSLSETTTCARLTDGTVHCCGDDSFGQLGLSNDAGHSSSFVRVAATSGRAVQVAAADHTTCLLLAGGEVTCWGSNEYGALGQGTRDDTIREMPVTVRFR